MLITKNQKIMRKTIFIMAGLLLSLLGLNGQNAAGGYKVIQKIHLEGDGFWDYLNADDATGMLYVSHGKMVNVVDMNTGKNVATITDVNGVHGIAIAPEFNKGFISNGKDASVSIFNLKTLELLTKVAVTGENPDAILYDNFSHLVFVFNGKTSNATVIDAKTDKVVATIALDGQPEFPASDGKGTIYINIEDKSLVDVISA